MSFYPLTDVDVAKEVGRRFKAMRLRKNLTQYELASRAMLSPNSIKSLEAGRAKLATMIAVLRELGALDDLENFIPDVPISPLQLAKMQGGGPRQRASRKSAGKRREISKGDDK